MSLLEEINNRLQDNLILQQEIDRDWSMPSTPEIMQLRQEQTLRIKYENPVLQWIIGRFEAEKPAE